MERKIGGIFPHLFHLSLLYLQLALSYIRTRALPLIYQQLGDLRVQSNPAVGRQESHECGDLLAMDGNEVKTAGKRKTKNSTSLAEEEKDLAKAKKESEEHSRQEQELKKKEDDDLRMALAVSKLQVSNDKSLSMSELKAKGKDLSDHLINVQTATSSEPTQLLPLGSVASSSARTNPATALFKNVYKNRKIVKINFYYFSIQIFFIRK